MKYLLLPLSALVVVALGIVVGLLAGAQIGHESMAPYVIFAAMASWIPSFGIVMKWDLE